MRVWLDTSSVQNPAELTTMTPCSVAALWSMWLKPWPKLTMAWAASISWMTSRGIATPWSMITSAPLMASMASPGLLHTYVSRS